MRDSLIRLRSDGGQLTLAALIQEREAAACEIERLRGQLQSRVPAVASRSAQKVKVTNNPSTDRRPAVPALHASALLRLKEVCALFGMSRSTIYKRVSDGSSPAQVKVGERSVRWRAEDLAAWRRDIAD